MNLCDRALWLHNCVLMLDAGARLVAETYLQSIAEETYGGNAGASNDDVTLTAQLAGVYEAQGYPLGGTLDYLVQDGGQHSEIYWAQRAPGALKFLLGPRAYLPPPGP